MLQQTYQLTEEAITLLGVSAEESRAEQPGQWNLKKGSFDIMIDVWEEQGQVLFQVICPLCTLPDENKEGFYLFLLERNHQLSAVTYTVFEGNVYLKHTREANGLSKEEIVNLLSKTAYYAEQSEFVPAD